jgi:hypothetical protein
MADPGAGGTVAPRPSHRPSVVRSIGRRPGLGSCIRRCCGPLIMAALTPGPVGDVQIAARHADPRTTTIYDRRRELRPRDATNQPSRPPEVSSRHFWVAPDWSRRLRSCRCCLCRRWAPDSIHVSEDRVGQAMSARSP